MEKVYYSILSTKKEASTYNTAFEKWINKLHRQLDCMLENKDKKKHALTQDGLLSMFLQMETK